MHIISRLTMAIMHWLNGPGAAPQIVPDTADWADLPTYHPSRD